ncbi:hypothetical protein MRB53_030944 [Persea americana]|uniref:Uncharacterized protein n=1 Tax=Persea americana TaxID=3435 RepID=A0ACC2KN85_PERAE|nr:hypothetical protein MRB53_030944 [Persea americana]
MNRGPGLLCIHNLPPAFDLWAPWSRSEAKWFSQTGTMLYCRDGVVSVRRGVPPHRLVLTWSAPSNSSADVEYLINLFPSVEEVALSSVEAFNSPLEMRRGCHVSLLRRARNHICRTPGLPEATLGSFEVGSH